MYIIIKQYFVILKNIQFAGYELKIFNTQLIIIKQQRQYKIYQNPARKTPNTHMQHKVQISQNNRYKITKDRLQHKMYVSIAARTNLNFSTNINKNISKRQQSYGSSRSVSCVFDCNQIAKGLMGDGWGQMEGCQYGDVRDIQGLYVYDIVQFNNKGELYSCQQYPSHQSHNKLIINKYNPKMPKHPDKQSQPIQIQQKDYAIVIGESLLVSGNYGTGVCSMRRIQWDSYCGDEGELRVDEFCLSQHKTVSGMYGIDGNHGQVFVLYKNMQGEYQEEEYFFDELADGFSIYNLEYKTPIYTYQTQRQSLTTNPIILNNFCTILGHYNHNDNSASLLLHDVRLNKSVVSVIDSSKQEFGDVSWFPYYNLVCRVGSWEIGTVWGKPAGRNTHVVRFDMRVPMRRQIMVKDVWFPKFLYCGWSQEEKEILWVIRNCYKQYRYQSTIIQALRLSNRR